MCSCVKVVLLLFISVALVHCSESGISNTEDLDVTPDEVVEDLSEPIIIGYGRAVLVEEENLLIKFMDVTEGRCPTGVLCFWAGQAVGEFLLIKKNDMCGIAEPKAQPGLFPGTEEYDKLADDALGYMLYLAELKPYPNMAHPTDPEDYVATLKIEELSEDYYNDKIVFVWTPPDQLQRDPVTIHGAEIDGDILMLTVTFSGGCGRHRFKLFMQPAFMESYPVQTNLYLQHTDLGDPCDAILSKDVSFDIQNISELYRDMYGGRDEIILNVFGYFIEVPGDKITVSYLPE
ncbi:MAG: hypothetical protein KOO63_12635 [Bacteroidales bacterium]|nr:hypothetical protein [Candidatus Latescibacterota bacterium]